MTSTKFLFVLLYFLSRDVFPCSIVSYSKFLLPDKTSSISTSDFIKTSDCSMELQDKFANLIISSEGHLNFNIIIEELGENVTQLSPKKIEVLRLSKLIKQQSIKRNSWFMRKTSFLGNTPIFHLKENNQIKIHCSHCNTPGEKNIKVNIFNTRTKNKRSLWAKGNILIRTKVLVAQKNLGISTPRLNMNMFKLVDYESSRPEQFFTQKINVSFYKLNKGIKQGDPLKFTDMNAIYLVNANKAVKIKLKSSNINLSGFAIPLTSGKFGDTIQLKNSKNKKILIGKVIDENKVIIDL